MPFAWRESIFIKSKKSEKTLTSNRSSFANSKPSNIITHNMAAVHLYHVAWPAYTHWEKGSSQVSQLLNPAPLFLPMKKLHPAYTCLSGGNFDTRGLVGPQEGDLIPPASWVKYPLIAGAGCVLTVTFTMPALPEKGNMGLVFIGQKACTLGQKCACLFSLFVLLAIRGVGGFHLFNRHVCQRVD